MIEIKHLNEAFSVFETDNENLRKKIAKLLSPHADNYQFNPRYRAGIWDGRVPFYRAKGNQILIPKGLLFYLEALFKKEKIAYEIEQTTYENISMDELNKFIHSLNLPFKPYDYQIKCVYDSLINGRLTNISATGSGKSLMIYLLMRWCLHRNQKMMIIVPSIMLVNQIYDDFISYGFSNIEAYCQRIGGEHKDKEITKKIIITTYQSQFRNSTEFYDVDYIIVDECHGTGVDSQIKEVILPKATKAKYRFGFTGTLPKSDISKLSIFSALGRPNKVINAQGLINQGLATPVFVKVVFLEYPFQEADFVNKQKSYPKEESYIIEHAKRNKIVTSIIKKVSKKGNSLVLYSKIKHGDFLLKLLISQKDSVEFKFIEVYKEINRKNIVEISQKLKETPKLKIYLKTPLTANSKNLASDILNSVKVLDELNIFCVSGEVNDKERERIRKILETHKDAIILGTLKTMSTGVNIKNLHNLIFASSTKSEITLGQSVGRIMRLHDSKSKVIVYDIVDMMIGSRKKENYSFKHFKERMNEYIDSGYPLKEYKIKL